MVSTLNRINLFIIVALLLGNAIVLSSPIEWVGLRLPVAVLFCFVLPGLAWLPLVNWLDTEDWLERLCWLIGGSSVLSALALFVALRLTVPFTESAVLVALTAVSGLGVLVQWGWAYTHTSLQVGAGSHSESVKKILHNRTSLIILAIIFAIGLFTRTVLLGYSEFHEDELENMRLIVRAYKGEAYAAFLDSKGPIHWLLPAALWFMTGWVNEAIARLPFVITSVTLIPLIYLLGRRLSVSVLPSTSSSSSEPVEDHSTMIGLFAAGFVAINGFFVAYARHVENQSLIVLWGALAVWALYRYHATPRLSYLLSAALALSVGLVAHPDVLLYLPVAGFMLAWTWWHRRPQHWRGIALTGGLFSLIVASFYIPYLLDPQIGLVYQYFTSDRIGESLLYNQVANLFDQDRRYSTRYHAPVLVGLWLWWLWQAVRQRALIPSSTGQGWEAAGQATFIGLIGLMISTLAVPAWWEWDWINLAFIPYLLLTLFVLVLPSVNFEGKLLTVWMMAPLGALLFLAKDAADHVQVAYPAWALLAAWGGTSLKPDRFPKPVRSVLAIAILIPTAALIISYQYLAFGAPVTTYWQAKIDSVDHPNAVYNWLYGSLPRPRQIFSNPRLGGWKVVGYLYETGQIQGDFRSVNESFAVPIWYTFQTPRSCYDDPQNYWVRRGWKGWPEEDEARIIAQGYQLARIVQVDQQPKLRLYEAGDTVAEAQVLEVDDFRWQFDLLATPSRFAQEQVINQPTSLNFGDKLLLRGYNLPPATAQPGQRIGVDVFWQALAPMDTRYRAFVHLVDGAGQRWGQHDDDPACRLLTTDMRPNQQSARQFRVSIAADTPAGEYQLLLGVYHPDTLARLPIWDNQAQNSPGDMVVLGTVEVGRKE